MKQGELTMGLDHEVIPAGSGLESAVPRFKTMNVADPSGSIEWCGSFCFNQDSIYKNRASCTPKYLTVSPNKATLASCSFSTNPRTRASGRMDLGHALPRGRHGFGFVHSQSCCFDGDGLKSFKIYYTFFQGMIIHKLSYS